MRTVKELSKNIIDNIYKIIFVITFAILLNIFYTTETIEKHVILFVCLIYIVISLYSITKKYKILKNIKKYKFEEKFKHVFDSQRNSKSKNDDDINFDNLVNKMYEEFIKSNASQGRNTQTNYSTNTDKLKNAYDLFNITRYESVKKIKSTYKDLVIKWHPDKWESSSNENKEIALRNFKKLQNAYNLIKKDRNIN